MSRLTTLTPVHPNRCLGPSTTPLSEVTSLREYCWRTWRVRKWHYDGIVAVDGYPASQITFSGTIDRTTLLDEIELYKSAGDFDFTKAQVDGVNLAITFHLGATARFGGTPGAELSDWTMDAPSITIGYSWFDSGAGLTRFGTISTDILTTSADISVFNLSVLGTDAVAGAPYAFVPGTVYMQAGGSNLDLVGHFDVTDLEYWPYNDAEGIPMYNTTTGALI